MAERRFKGVKLSDMVVKDLLSKSVGPDAVMTGCRWDPYDNTIECFFWDPDQTYETPEACPVPFDVQTTWTNR